jgi:hypothetical protein
MKDWTLKGAITIMATFSLMGVVACMIWMFLLAIYDPTVDDQVVFQIIGPAFQTIVGGFIGLITGIHIGEKKNDAIE